MTKTIVSIISFLILISIGSISFAEDSACHDLRESHKDVDKAIHHLEHHRDQGKRAAIIDALKAARGNIDAEKTNLGCN